MENQHTYRYLQELSRSDYQIVGGEPNILGWKVHNEHGTAIGSINELLFDPETQAVRYLVIDLTGNGMHLDGKNVMIPIGLAHIHIENDEVVLPNIHMDQFEALPVYHYEELGPETEIQIRSIIGSPAALRIEDTITEIDQQDFYEHHHFNAKQFYERRHVDTPPTSGFRDLTGGTRPSDGLAGSSQHQHFTASTTTHPLGTSENGAHEDNLDNPLTRGI